MIAKEEIWADADGNAVPFGDSRGRTVLFGEGATISDADAKKYGIVRGKLGGSEDDDNDAAPKVKTDAEALADLESSKAPDHATEPATPPAHTQPAKTTAPAPTPAPAKPGK